MELSLFSRDVIAMATAVALVARRVRRRPAARHVRQDRAGPADRRAVSSATCRPIFVPAGPMTSGLPNAEKAKVRQQYAQGQVDREELLEAESQSYHGAGTCTFYGTANSNQMLLEMMGLHLPGIGLRQPEHAAARCADASPPPSAPARSPRWAGEYTPIWPTSSTRRSIVNAHRRPAGHGRLDQPRAAPGRHRAQPRASPIDWDDFDELSRRHAAAGTRLPQRRAPT